MVTALSAAIATAWRFINTTSEVMRAAPSHQNLNLLVSYGKDVRTAMESQSALAIFAPSCGFFVPLMVARRENGP